MKSIFKKLFVSLLIVVFTTIIFSNQVKAQENTPPETEGKTVVDVVNEKDATSEFGKMLKESGYAQVLKQEGTFTVLAPNNEAINNTEEALKKTPRKLIQGHLFKGKISADQVESEVEATVKETDDSATNGVVYVIDQVANK